MSIGSSSIDLDSLAPGTTLIVRTQNSEYRFVTVHERRMLAQGGERFPVPTVVRLEGATGGGSALRAGWIVVGLPMEMRLGFVRLRSSPVRSISIDPRP